MNKTEVYHYLTEKGIRYEAIEHSAAYTMEELESLSLPHCGSYAKNLFVCDDKKERFYLLSVKGNKRVNLKEFRKIHHLRRLSFASKEALQDYLELLPGSVTPLGLLNDSERKVTCFLDREFDGGYIGVHPNENTATVWMEFKDFVQLLQEHGTTVSIVDFKESCGK